MVRIDYRRPFRSLSKQPVEARSGHCYSLVRIYKSVSFGIGVTSASFHCVGNMFEATDVFMTEVRTRRIEPKESLITRIGISIDSESFIRGH